VAKVRRERAENVALGGVLLHLVFAGIGFALAWWTRCQAMQVEAWHLLLGVPFWGLALIHLRQQRRADEEEEEMERLETARRAGRERRRLFEEGEEQAFVASARLRQLQKYFIPGFTVLAALLLGALAWISAWSMWTVEKPAAIQTQLISMLLLAAVAFFCLLIGKYAAGMSRQPEWGLLRAGASYMMSCALGSAVVAGGLALAQFGMPRPERVAGYAIAALMGLVAIEIIINFILDFYRPRVPGQEPRPAFDSRMLGLLTEPTGILKTAAATLDYQFGFKISQTWFYRFLERAMAPVILFQLAAFYMLTCVCIVGPDELAIIERFGRPLREVGATDEVRVFNPGFHCKLPWPIDKVRRHPAKRIQSINIGYELKEAEEPDERAKGRKKVKIPILWDIQHYEKEYHVLVALREEAPAYRGQAAEMRQDEGVEKGAEITAPPVNLLSAHVQVQFRIKTKEADRENGLYDYLYRVREPNALLEAIAYRELIRYLAGVDMFDVMGPERAQASRELQKRIQESADKATLGIKIVFVGLQGIHPPVEEEVGKAFQAVIAAQQSKEAEILKARGYSNKVTAKTRHESQILLTRARAQRYEYRVWAEAQAERFKTQLLLDRVSPVVYRMREYLSAIETALADARKYVMPGGGMGSIILDLKDIVRPEIFDIGFKGPETPGPSK